MLFFRRRSCTRNGYIHLSVSSMKYSNLQYMENKVWRRQPLRSYLHSHGSSLLLSYFCFSKRYYYLMMLSLIGFRLEIMRSILRLNEIYAVICCRWEIFRVDRDTISRSMVLVQYKNALAVTSQVEQQRNNLISPLIVVRNKIEMIYVKKVSHKFMLCTVVYLYNLSITCIPYPAVSYIHFCRALDLELQICSRK